MNKAQLRGSLILLLATIIWGGAFVAQSVGLDYIPPFAFNGIRITLGGVCLIPVVLIHFKKHPEARPNTPKDRKQTLLAGLCCGLCLFAGSAFQQFGLISVDPGKAGFITSLYVVLVPVAQLFFGHKGRWNLWAGVGLSVIGLFLLCVTGKLRIQTGDICLLMCGVCFTFHILVVDHFSDRVDGVLMSILQFFVAGFLCLFCMAIFEKPTLGGIWDAAIPIVYAGAFSCAMGYTFQIIGQKTTEPTIASIILALESVFAVLAGWIILGDTLTIREWFGCALMMAAILIVQLPSIRE